MAEEQLKAIPQIEEPQVDVEFPYLEENRNPGGGYWFYVVMITVFVIVGLLGLLIQYTPIGNKSETMEDGKLLPLDRRKRWWALIPSAFNPVENFQKLMKLSTSGDQNL